MDDATAPADEILAMTDAETDRQKPAPALLRALAWVATIVGSFFFLRLFDDALIDDVFINLQYSRTLWESGSWGWFPGQTGNTATSPANMVLLAGFGAAVGDWVLGVIVSTWAASIALFALTLTLSKQATGRVTAGAVAGVALIANPLLVSSMGLESHWLLVGLAAMLSARVARRDWLLGSIAGLTFLVRPDTVVLFALMIATWPRRLQLRAALPFSAITAAWVLFSWRVLGSMVLDTLFIKKIQGDSWDSSLANGLSAYAETFPFEVITSFLLLPAAVALFRLDKDSPAALVTRLVAVLGLGHFTSYVLLGVAPYHWYYAPLVFSATLLGALGVDRLWASGRLLERALAFSFALGPAVAMALWLYGQASPVAEMPIQTNLGTHSQYREIGLALADLDLDGGILHQTEIGTIGFYCRCPVYDVFSDRRIFAHFVRESTSRYALKSLFYRLNFYFFRDDEAEVNYPPARYRFVARRPIGSRVTPDEIRRFTVHGRWVPEGADLALERIR
ncbi:MAG: hypothetical protein AAGM22_23525 [Acidobacteriota bacterium]